jgi:hypothetical protein
MHATANTGADMLSLLEEGTAKNGAGLAVRRAYEGVAANSDKALEGLNAKKSLRIKRSSATNTEKVMLP